MLIRRFGIYLKKEKKKKRKYEKNIWIWNSVWDEIQIQKHAIFVRIQFVFCVCALFFHFSFYIIE